MSGGTTQLELAAYHEAAHSVAVVNDRWHYLCSSVKIAESGHGTAYFQFDNERAKNDVRSAALANLDDVFRKAAILALVGVCAEIRLLEIRGEPAPSFADAAMSSREDTDLARWAIDQMVRPVPLEDLVDRALQVTRENSKFWCAVEKFAAVLLERRQIPPKEATDLLLEIEKSCAAS